MDIIRTHNLKSELVEQCTGIAEVMGSTPIKAFFFVWSFIVLLRHFRSPGWKFHSFNKTGTATALSLCPHPNLKRNLSMFCLFAYLNLFFFLEGKYIEHSFSFNFSLAIIFPAVLILLTKQCRVWIRWFCSERSIDSVSFVHCLSPSFNSGLFQSTSPFC